jgi:hypothetical protein
MGFEPYVLCKHSGCRAGGVPIRLPYPILLTTKSTRPLWPKDDWRAWIATLECDHLCEYTAQDVHWEEFPLKGRNQSMFWFRLNFVCGAEKCGLPIELSLETHGVTVDRVVLGIIDAGTFSAQILPCGHYLVPEQMKNREAHRVLVPIRSYRCRQIEKNNRLKA